MNTLRRKRILTKVAGLPRALANIAKNVVRKPGSSIFSAVPISGKHRVGSATRTAAQRVTRKLLGQDYARTPQRRRWPFAENMHPDDVASMGTYRRYPGDRIAGTHGGKAQFRATRSGHVSSNYLRGAFERGRLVPRMVRLLRQRLADAQSPTIGKGPHLAGVDLFESNARKLGMKAKAKRDAAKHTSWGNWGKFKTRGPRPTLSEREDWLGMRDPRNPGYRYK